MSTVAYAHSTLLTYILSYKLLNHGLIFIEKMSKIYILYLYLHSLLYEEKLSDFIYEFLFTYLKK